MFPQDQNPFLKKLKSIVDHPTTTHSLKPIRRVNSEPASPQIKEETALNLNLLFDEETVAKEEREEEVNMAKQNNAPQNNAAQNNDDQNNANRTLREIMAPVVNRQRFCVRAPAGGTPFELKSPLLQQLPIFHGLAGENAYSHLDQFHMVCSTMKPTGVTDEQIQLRAFPFSLADQAKEWIYSLPAGSITSWTQMERAFLESSSLFLRLR